MYTLTIAVNAGKLYNDRTILLHIVGFDKEEPFTHEHITGDSGTVSATND
ncbi:hypothetical protein KDAU_23060 [Dictyobacter aurantiacus]|uniref:Uncharacterized protein n=1 Tax=Dictyobacter aurantiacus TaxID=1936993 RepID=A0A401ZDM3_9CHLR|nr:hypothetical protein KDAU_23060 [Dictyobacter aurantiacus]